MADGFRAAGSDKIDFQVLPAFGNEGHFFAEGATMSDFELLLDCALKISTAAAVKR